jgi:HipA N-terminal domain
MKITTWILGLMRSDKASPIETAQSTTHDDPIVFLLMYKGNQIGTLKFTGDRWVFIYSDWFKIQSGIKPFANFPDIDKEYVSEDLPPFFESRIPGLSQPQVEVFLQELKSKADITEKETKVALLKKFGRRTITNPFELQPAL